MNENRIGYLDGLRGILAVIVFVHHFLYVFCPEIMLGGSYEDFLKPEWNIYKIIALTPVNIFFNPGMAINFFFLLSGFVQSFQYFQKPELQTLQKSFIKRYFRLIIPTLSVVILVFLFHQLNFFHKGYLPKNNLTQTWINSQLPDKFTFFEVIKYSLIDLVNGNSSYYQVLWTIPLEVLNSWLVLILLLITHKMKHKSFIFIFYTLILLLVLQSFYRLSFLLGLLLCYFYMNAPNFKSFFSKPIVKWLCFLVGIYLASYPFVGYQNSVQHTIYKPLSFADHKPVLLFVFGNLLLFCALLYSTRMKHILEKNVFRFLGEISFMFYLTHFFILFSFSAVFYYSLRGILSFYTNVFVSFIVSFFVVTLTSYVLYKCVDKPVLQFFNRAVRKLFE